MLINPDNLPGNLLSALQYRLLSILTIYSAGVKEYDLLMQLKQENLIQVDDAIKSANLSLYHQHFLLFNALYQLRDKLLEHNIANIIISPLNIQLVEIVEGERQLGEHDSLRDYYLDMQNLTASTEQSVNDLLDKFWTLLIKNNNRDEALAVLGLCEPASDKQIVDAYRRLVMVHHPDRGGDNNRLQQINRAYAELVK